jgi:hypothetical protein
LRFMRFTVALVGTFAVGLVLWSQDVNPQARRVPLPHDWSHRHLIFSEPKTLQDSVRIQGDARYWHQRGWRSRSRVSEVMDNSDSDANFWMPGRRRRRRRGKSMKRDWGESLGLNATVGAGMFPAKFSFDITTASCGNATTPDYVVFNTSLASASTQAGIVAFDNLYSGCTGTVPSLYWAYDTTGTGDGCSACAVVTSVVLSLDGTQMAFVGSSASGSFLYILKPKAGEGTVSSPVKPTTSTTSASTYVTCRNLTGASATSCLLSLPLGSHSDTNSSPFYSYAFDTLYAGDDSGVLYKFTGVFGGSPAQVTTVWPITVHSGFSLTSPVYDQTSGNVYVEDSNGRLSFVRDTGNSVGACGSGSPPCLGANTLNAGGGASGAIVDGPIVDSTNKQVFVFVGNDGGGNSGAFQTPTDLSSHVEATVGPQFGNTLYSGAFDNEYYTSVGSGHLYVCGNVSSPIGLNVAQNLALFRIGFNNSGTMKSATDVNSLTLTSPVVPLLGGTPAACSPATEVSPSSSSDLIFFSVTGSSVLAGCTGLGCITSVSIPTASPFTFPTTVSHTLPASIGTSGIIIDNVATNPTGTSQVYFTPLGNSSAPFPCGSPSTSGVGCAIQASQAGLQ